jgi:translation initiation factor IF-1
MPDLTPKETAEYIQWARDNYHTKVGVSGAIKAIWHPAVRQEMHRIRLRQMDKIKLRVKEMAATKAAICYE